MMDDPTFRKKVAQMKEDPNFKAYLQSTASAMAEDPSFKASFQDSVDVSHESSVDISSS
jgi:hypothetical protein